MRRWRLMGSLALAAAVAAAAGGVAYGYFTASGTGTGSGSVGTLTLSVNSSATHTCTYALLSPGDLTGSSTCTLSVTYGGAIASYVSLTVAIWSQAGSGGQLLYDGSNTNGLTFSISDGHNSYTVPTTPTTCPSSAPSGSTCWTADNDLAASYSGSTPSLTFTNGETATWTLTPLFPTSVNNPYQGATATVTLTAQAVQAPANTLPASCSISTIGEPCPASGSFFWS